MSSLAQPLAADLVQSVDWLAIAPPTLTAIVGLVVLVVIPVWTMLARLYVGAHHVSDVLTELVVASFWIWTCARLLLPRRTTAAARERTRAEAPAAA